MRASAPPSCNSRALPVGADATAADGEGDGKGNTMVSTTIDLDAMATGWLQAAAWADAMPDCDCEPGSCGCESGGFTDIEPTDAARAYALRLCTAFVERHTADCEAYCEQHGGWQGPADSFGRDSYSAAECLGHDLRMTGSGHGVGFWDRDLGDLGERLTEASKARAFSREGGGDAWEGGDGLLHIDEWALD